MNCPNSVYTKKANIKWSQFHKKLKLITNSNNHNENYIISGYFFIIRFLYLKRKRRRQIPVICIRNSCLLLFFLMHILKLKILPLHFQFLQIWNFFISRSIGNSKWNFAVRNEFLLHNFQDISIYLSSSIISSYRYCRKIIFFY